MKSHNHGATVLVEMPPVAKFPVVPGQFSDPEEDDPPRLVEAGQDKNSQNLAAIFHSSSKSRTEGIRTVGVEIDPGNNEDSINQEQYDIDDEGDDSDYDEDDNFEFYGEKSTGPNSQKQNDQVSSEELFRKFVNKIKIEKYEGIDELPSGAGNKIISANKKHTANRQKVKDKQDRATVEQVMDPRTRMILYKLLSSEKILSIDGCISTGKEANVYHATGPEGTAYAIKIFKTSILTFKTRDKYVTGEYRFRQGYCKKNPRKMVRVWAEKEFRNLLRIHSAQTVLVPQPRLLKSHVLVMDFIGSNGWPCPLLKDVKFDQIDFGEEDQHGNLENHAGDEDESKNPLQNLFKKLYRDCLLILYRLYKHCKLVHADFSEFNLILKDNKDVYVIDVSQSVEHDHPRSFDFLRSDIKNIQEFFGKRILVGDYKDIFDFITSATTDDSNYESVLESILRNTKTWENLDVLSEVFRQAYIPRKMEDVEHFERDYARAKKGETELIYANIMGMKSDLSGPEQKKDGIKKEKHILGENSTTQSETHREGSCSSSSNSESDSDSEASETGTVTEKKHVKVRPKDETAEEKKERKKQVKLEKAEKRQTKVKKHVKKRSEKLSHANSKRK